jgi:hypothetical protein
MESVFLQVQPHMVQLQVNFINLLLLFLLYLLFIIKMNTDDLFTSVERYYIFIMYYVDKTELIPEIAVD